MTPSSTAQSETPNLVDKRALARERARIPRPRVRLARFEDYDQIIRLEATLNPDTLSRDDWRMLWLGNPLWQQVSSWWKIGWVLEIPGGEIVGCMGNLPTRYHFRGEHLMAASGRGWMVLPEYRAYGSARRLLEAHLQQPSVDFVLDTSVSPEASERFGFLAKKVPPADWETVAYFVTGYRAFAARALHKLKVPFAEGLAPAGAVALSLRDTIFGKRFAKHSAFTIEEAGAFDSRFDDFWAELLRQKSETILAARDSATLSWHFAMPMRNRRLWILTASRNRQLRAYAIFERKDTGEELRRMRLVDYQTIEQDIRPPRGSARGCAAPMRRRRRLRSRQVGAWAGKDARLRRVRAVPAKTALAVLVPRLQFGTRRDPAASRSFGNRRSTTATPASVRET